MLAQKSDLDQHFSLLRYHYLSMEESLLNSPQLSNHPRAKHRIFSRQCSTDAGGSHPFISDLQA